MSSHNAYIALWTAFRVCCPEGSVLGAPMFSFVPLFRKQMMANNVHLAPLDCDEYGILPESLENACVTRNLKVLTCSPECELPTTARMSKRRRMEIAEAARKYDIIIIENNWLLPTGHEPELPAIAMLAPERTIFLEHGSKMLSCESFCSFSYVPEFLRSKFIYTRNITAGPLPLLIRKITQFWLEQGLVERDFNKKNAEILIRNDMLEEIFANHPIKIHKRARFAWLPLAKKQSAMEIRQRLEGADILVSTSHNFLIGSSLNNEAPLIGIGHEPSRWKLRNALERIEREVEESPDM